MRMLMIMCVYVARVTMPYSASKKRQKSDPAASSTSADSFAVNTSDSRFTALYDNPSFSIDPTSPAYKATLGTDEILKEKQRRRMEQQKENIKAVQQKKQQLKQQQQQPVSSHHASSSSAAFNDDADANVDSATNLASIVASVKRKSQLSQQQQQSFRDRANASKGHQQQPSSKRAGQQSF